MFKVLKGGIMATVQDLGRPGFTSQGVPICGAFDAFSLKAGNYLLKNHLGEAGIEVLFPGFHIQVLSEMTVAITGGDLSPEVNGSPVDMWRAIRLTRGDVLHFTGLKSGCRSYIAFSGGIALPEVLGSKSTFLRGKMGGVQGRMLKEGDILHLGYNGIPISQIEGRHAKPPLVRNFADTANIRVIKGLEDFLFTEESVELFFSAKWKVSTKADRMGVCLNGPQLAFKPRENARSKEGGSDPSHILTDCMPLGAIQVVSGREPIVMGVDGPASGGYAKIGTVLSCDLSLVAQLITGNITMFNEICLEEGIEILKAQTALFSEDNVDF